MESILKDYKPISGIYDEVLSGDGKIKFEYKKLFEYINSLNESELDYKKKQSVQILEEHGATYNFYKGIGSLERTWQLDILPLIIHKKEWNKIEKGLAQRGKLLSLIIQDIYGPKKLLIDHVMPAEVIYSSTGYLRNVEGFDDLLNESLPFFASDLVRDSNGDFYVIGDKIQAPSGSGYTLENRLVISRIFSELYKESNVSLVQNFFVSLKNKFKSIANSIDKEPFIVFLTPGPSNETFFEHAFLAKQLDYILAQGEDFAVRENKVYMKTVDGLEKVDLIFKRVNDIFMDSLELRSDSMFGVPGLIECIKDGNVKVVNPIGGSILENRAILGYMNSICRYFLKEDLLLPVVPTYWLGEVKDREAVLSDIDNYIIKYSQRDPAKPIYTTINMKKDEIRKLKEEIHKVPGQYIAQKILPGSTCPILNADNSIGIGKVVYRTYSVSTNGSYETMPGGLIRVANHNEIIVKNQKGAGSKDLWILSTETEKETIYFRESVIDFSSNFKEESVPSRIAENLFWSGRYLERSENLARILREIILKTVDIKDEEAEENVRLLLKALTHLTGIYPGFMMTELEESIIQSELKDYIYSPILNASLKFNINSFLYSIKNIRDRLNEDSILTISRIEKFTSSSNNISEIHEYLSQLILYFYSFSGMLNESMSHGLRWQFLYSGKRIERAILIVRLLWCSFVNDLFMNQLAFESLLKVFDVYLTYKRRHAGRIDIRGFLNILIFEEDNPRSIRYQLTEIDQNVNLLTNGSEEGIELVKLISHSLSKCKYSEHWELWIKENKKDSILKELNEIQNSLFLLSDGITNKYFNYVEEKTYVG